MAADFLKRQGYCISEINFRCKFGEIDIVATDGEYLCFVEVKYRTSSKSGHPEEAVNYRKQRRICRVSDFYLLRYGKGMDTQIRYDVVAIEGTEICLYKNAFVYIPG